MRLIRESKMQNEAKQEVAYSATGYDGTYPPRETHEGKAGKGHYYE